MEKQLFEFTVEHKDERHSYVNVVADDLVKATKKLFAKYPAETIKITYVQNRTAESELIV